MTHLKVAVRIRPLSAREIETHSTPILTVENEKTVAITNIKVPEQNAGDSRERIRRFTFDLCFHENSTQDNVFQAVEDVIRKAIQSRYHSCVLAYGQSSTGKTHTMMGFPHDPGLIPRLCQRLFVYLEESAVAEEIDEPKITVSYLEIYNEKVHDLLLFKSQTKTNLKIRQHPKKGPYVQGLSEHCVTNSTSLLQVLEQGTQNRRVGATNSNPQSSRSHSVFVVNFCGVKLTLVDLAGSERAGNRCYTTSRFREGANINKSLVALGNVISALAEDTLKFTKGARRRFIPYRDSVLTWLLKDTLGGNSDTVMIATISPSSACYSETVNTLRFGQRAKLIVSIPVVNEDPKEKTIRLLRAEIARLRELLKIGPTLDNALSMSSTPPPLPPQPFSNQEEAASTSQLEKSEELIPVMAVTAEQKPHQSPRRLRRTFSVASVKNKDTLPLHKSEETISVRNKKPPLISRKSSIDHNRPLKTGSTSNTIKKTEKSVSTELTKASLLPKIESKVDSIRRSSLLKPGRSQIVAAVTHRLYAKTKKKEVATDTSDINQSSEPKELMICSNARMKLKELTRKALKAHRSKNEETQTDLFPILRVKEISTDSDDLRICLNEMRNAETSTNQIEMLDKEVGCSFLSCFNEDLSKHLTLTKSCGTQSEKENAAKVVSFTKYLRDFDVNNPILTSAVNINISHNYINGQRVSSSISEDSLEDGSHLCFPTPDLISNHNSLEPHTYETIRQAISVEQQNQLENVSDLQLLKIVKCFAKCSVYAPKFGKIDAVYIPSVCAPQICILKDFRDCFCKVFEPKLPPFAKPNIVENKTYVDDCVTLLEPLVLKSIMKHDNTELPDSLDYHLANNHNSKKVRFTTKQCCQNERMFKAMSGFLEEATILMNNLSKAATATVDQRCFDYDYEVQVSVNDVSGLVDEQQNCKRKRKSDAKCQTDDKPNTKSNYVQTTNVANTTTANSSTQFYDDDYYYDFDVPANKYELLLEDSCRRLEQKIHYANQQQQEHNFEMQSDEQPWSLLHQMDSLESQPVTFSDYGSLPRRRARCSPSAFLRQLTNMRQQVVEATREEFLNDYAQ